MAPLATEFANLYLKAGLDITDPSKPEHQTWEETLATVSSQDGFKQAYYGTTLEDPTWLQLIIDWTSVEDHQKFIDSPQYGPFVKRLGALLADPPSLYHVHFDKPTSLLLTGGTTEVATFYGTSDQSRFLANVGRFIEATKNDIPGAQGHIVGSTVEEIAKRDGTSKGKAVVLAIAWESKEKHMAFRETATFKDNIHHLRDGMTGVEMHHTTFRKY